MRQPCKSEWMGQGSQEGWQEMFVVSGMTFEFKSGKMLQRWWDVEDRM